MVGTAGFEPTTPTPPVWCATWLRYAPTKHQKLDEATTTYIAAARDRHNTAI